MIDRKITVVGAQAAAGADGRNGTTSRQRENRVHVRIAALA